MKRYAPMARQRSPSAHPSCVENSGSIQASLRQLLTASSNGDPLRVDLPPVGAVRMRNLVHRGTQKPVFKVPSLTLGRTVQCESLLEYEAALLLDASPQVRSYAEQPARIHFALCGAARSHIPDFAVLVGRRKAFLEIKFNKDVTTEVHERTAVLKNQLSRLGWEYHLLTESVLRHGSVLENAKSILRRARHATSEIDSLRVLEHLRSGSGKTLGDYGWTAHQSVQAANIAQLITDGHAEVDWLEPLSDTSPVCATHALNEEAAPWLLAPSA